MVRTIYIGGLVMVFGFRNSTITEIYVPASQTADIYGSLTLTTPITANHKAWLEENTIENRQIEGDIFRRTATVTTSFLVNLDEGNIITVVPYKIGSETAQTTRKWRITNRGLFFSSVSAGKRIQMIELKLLEEAS